MIKRSPPNKRASRPKHAAWVIALTGIILIQLRTAVPQTAGQFDLILNSIGQPAVWRGANFFGQEFADLIAFFHQEIPDDALVILPPRGIGVSPLTITQYMQYFLFPRNVRNCSGEYEACIRAFQDEPGSYLILAEAGRFSDSWEKLSIDRVRMFSADYGVLAPESTGRAAGRPLEPYQGFADIFRDLVLGTLYLAGLWLLGGVILATWLPGLHPVELAGFGFGLGAGVFSILTTIPLMWGGKLSAQVVWTVFGISLLLSASIYFLANRDLPRLKTRSIDFIRSEKGLIPIVILGVVSVFLATGLGYHRDDALGIWAPKGYGISLAGFPEGPTEWGTLTTEYPLQIPMLIAGMRSVFSERLPESKLIFPFFSTAALITIYGYFRRKTSSLLSGTFCVVVGTAPIFLSHSMIAYANLAAGYLFISGVFLIAFGLERTPQELRYRFFGSLFLALAAWTRPEILPIAFLTVSVFTLADIRVGFSLRKALVIFAPLTGYALFWVLVRQAAYAQAGFTSGSFRDVLAGLGRGEFYPAETAQVGRFFFGELLALDTWGLLGWVGSIGLLGVLILKIRLKAAVPMEIFIGMLYIAVILGGYALTPFLDAREHPVDWWIRGGLDRMVMPGVLLVCTAAVRRLIGLLDRSFGEHRLNAN